MGAPKSARKLREGPGERDRPPAPVNADRVGPAGFGYRRDVPDLRPSERRLPRAAAKAGVGASAFAVFACGWLAMRATEWPRILLFTLLAVAAAGLASFFSRAAR
jgi:hypothetical protein